LETCSSAGSVGDRYLVDSDPGPHPTYHCDADPDSDPYFTQMLKNPNFNFYS
jgi:hypothetical protein